MEETPVEGEPVQERGGAAIRTQVSGLQRHYTSRAEVESIAGVHPAIETQFERFCAAENDERCFAMRLNAEKK